MLSLIIIVVVFAVMLAGGIYEYVQHQKYLSAIPVRIHINGTRGKSSVSRLIGAGLRAGGFNTVTKVTGTFPRLIMSDGTEAAIHRKEKANILEQLNIIKYCARQNANVLILECMALRPKYQWICEQQMVKATHGVITNIRLDHLDVMGPTLDDVARALCGTIPSKAQLFTSEDRCFGYVNKVAKKRKTKSNQALGDHITEEDMKGFRYIEHKANIDLALQVCLSLGVEREQALSEMKKTIPDEGALTRTCIQEAEKEIMFYNGFAANDPESTLMIWDSILDTLKPGTQKIILLNTRKDRQDRARQLIEMIGQQLEFDLVALIGESEKLVEQMAIRAGIARQKIACIGNPETEEKLQQLVNCAKQTAMILGVGNMGVGGADLAKHIELKHANL